jgi:hypothetical protein
MENRENKGKNKNLNNAFSAEIIDSDAPPPPELPISIVQTIGIEQCRTPPSELSMENLSIASAKCD